MKYIIIPFVKILTVLILILIIAPCKWVFHLMFHFRWLSARKTFTFQHECIFDYTLLEWVKELFSKESTNNFLEE